MAEEKDLGTKCRPVVDCASKAAPGVLRKVLMTAFHFPPQVGSSGVQRTLNFVRYLPENGWNPIVLTARPKAYEKIHNHLQSQIPKDVEVVRARALDAARHLSVRRKYSSLTAIPDRWSSWWFDAVRQGKSIIEKRRPDILWSTYPIATAHLIGASLAKWSGLPWVADFRDPMVTPAFPEERLRRYVSSRLEARVLREASLCIFTTERAADTYRSRYPDASSRCHVIPNGYDEEAFSDLSPVRRDVEPGTLLLLHSGIMYPHGRNPEPFLAAIAELLQRQLLQRERLCIRFRAPVHAEEISILAAKHGLQEIVDVAPSIPYREAIAEMMGADLLLLFQGATFNAQIPAKLYEYVRSLRPILGVVDINGDAARELRKFEDTYLANISVSNDISCAIEGWLHARQRRQELARSPAALDLIHGFSRRHQTANLAELLNSCPSQNIQH